MRRHEIARPLVCFAATLLLSAWGCGGSSAVTESALSQARARWSSAKLKDYDLEWVGRGEYAGNFLVYFREGRVAQVRSVEPDGREVILQPDDPERYGVEGLFRMIEGRRGTSARFAADRTLGYPTMFRSGDTGFDVIRVESSPEPQLPRIPAPAGTIPAR